MLGILEHVIQKKKKKEKCSGTDLLRFIASLSHMKQEDRPGMTEQKQWCEGIIIYFDAQLITPRHFWEPRHSEQYILFLFFGLFHLVSKIVISRRET